MKLDRKSAVPFCGLYCGMAAGNMIAKIWGLPEYADTSVEVSCGLLVAGSLFLLLYPELRPWRRRPNICHSRKPPYLELHYHNALVLNASSMPAVSGNFDLWPGLKKRSTARHAVACRWSFLFSGG